MNTIEQCCETCAWAMWDEGDSSVGMSASVDDCNCQFIDVEEVWDDMDNDENYECSAYLLRHDPEWMKTRCTGCNSPNTKWNGKKTPNTEEWDFKTVSVCKDCGNEFEHGIY